jgi:ribonuclease HII
MHGLSDAKYLVGVDENGLGPRLGPLIVTAVLVRADERGAKVASSRARGKLRERLDDSKALVSFRERALGEAWARAIHARTSPHVRAGTVDDLIHALSLDARAPLRAMCPDGHAPQCWRTDGEELSRDDTLVRDVARDLETLAARGVAVVGARVAIVCTRRINDAVARGFSRFHVDLHTMERLVVWAREAASEEIVATCGKVGGFDRYGDRFGGPLAGRLHLALQEGRAKSSYKMPGIGTIAFVRDADASHMLVSMASLVGKWVRDVLMSRIVRHHRASVPHLPDASGYYDAITTRFIDASALARKKAQLPDACFVRNRLELEESTDSRRPTSSAQARKSSARPKETPATP